MKKFVTSLLLSLFASISFAQLAITEYSNNPYAGGQTTEFIEIYNYSGDTVSLDGWTIIGEDVSETVILDSSYGSLDTGEYLVLTRSVSDFNNEWFSGSTPSEVFGGMVLLKNGGESVILQSPDATYSWTTGVISQGSNAATLVLDSSYDFSSITGSVTASSSDYISAVDGVAGAFESENGAIGSPLAGGYSPIPESSQAALMLGALVMGIVASYRRR